MLADTTDTNSEPPTTKTPEAIVSVLDRVDPSVQQSRVICAASTGDSMVGREPGFENANLAGAEIRCHPRNEGV